MRKLLEFSYFLFSQINSNITHIFIVIFILGAGGRSTYGCYGVILGGVCGDVIKINGVRAKPLIFVKVIYLVDMHKYM